MAAGCRMEVIRAQAWLNFLGYYDGRIGAAADDPNFRDDVRRFQADSYPHAGPVDGIYGKRTEAHIKELRYLFERAERLDGGLDPGVGDIGGLRRWRKTSYWIGRSESSGKIPMLTPDGNIIAKVSAHDFVEAALEGTTKLDSGKLVNVATRPKYRPVDPEVYEPVRKIAERYGWIPDRPGYAGIVLDGDGKVVKARTFRVIREGPNGWPIWNKIEASPFRTVAADIGRMRRSDPKWKGKGGVVPVRSEAFILELAGRRLPDGSIHDGWVVVNDTGGGIYGAHFDLFIGYKSWRSIDSIAGLPEHRIHVWFEGIEEKIPMNYSYGL